jgi:hypothetical protein
VAAAPQRAGNNRRRARLRRSDDGNEAPFSSAKLVLCLANPYEQAVPTRAPTGLRLVDTKPTLSAGMVTNPTSAGSFVWRALVTPWTANGQRRTPRTIEAQSIVNIPHR